MFPTTLFAEFPKARATSSTEFLRSGIWLHHKKYTLWLALLHLQDSRWSLFLLFGPQKIRFSRSCCRLRRDRPVYPLSLVFFAAAPNGESLSALPLGTMVLPGSRLPWRQGREIFRWWQILDFHIFGLINEDSGLGSAFKFSYRFRMNGTTSCCRINEHFDAPCHCTKHTLHCELFSRPSVDSAMTRVGV